MSQLEGAMAAMIKVFHNYSGKEGDKYTLSNGELKDLIKNELGNFLGDPKDQAAVEKIMKMLDENKDGHVDFNEYVVLIAAITTACNEFFKDQKKK
ncbi:protein S100-Z-like [Acipenser ruthenus]|uniref:protein S100-Z-like n=1 Tax=Acipenser ruthenus TaxID=7906 RepID=UPI00156142D3|nr:protein S100-Z-like [Acipenser ruthenus]XP_058875633.1 protein S100-Z-like [Acipenser ruthenus]